MKGKAAIACIMLGASVLGGQTPVRVKVLPPAPETQQPLRLVLNQPAYVAAFVVYPGAGVRLIYPLVNEPERLQHAGMWSDQLLGLSFDNEFYAAVLGPRLDGPEYLYVIASRHPLDVARYVHSPMRLASAVGVQASRSFYADVAFDALLNNAVSLGGNDSWDSDVYTLWPPSETERRLASAERSGPQSGYTTVSCADGSVRSVPSNYPFAGCPGDARVRVKPPAAKPPQVAAARAPITGGAADLVVSGAPTVLPTIIGPRPSVAEQRAATRQDGSSQRVVYTVANGGDAAVAPAAEGQVPAPTVEVVNVDPERSVEARRQERERLHAQYSAQQREQHWQQNRAAEQERAAARAPRLSPNPEPGASPRLAPPPNVAPHPQPPQSSAPRTVAVPRP